MLEEPFLVIGKVAQALDHLGVPYVVGGSVASSVYGVPRATLDVDLVADLAANHVDPLVALLSGEFYIDADMIYEAIARRACFNVIHLATMFKADIFVPARDAWSRSEMARGRVETVGEGAEAVSIRFASPEDTLLHKLVWYQLGHHLSERQWRDVLGVLDVQGGFLDQSYLDTWAASLGVADLLRRARDEAPGLGGKE